MRIHFICYLGCWKNLIPCGLWLRSPFLCWLSAEGYSQLLEAAGIPCLLASFLHSESSNTRASSSHVCNPCCLSFSCHLSDPISASSSIFRNSNDYVGTTWKNTEWPPYLKMLNLITLAKSHLPCNLLIHKFPALCFLGSRYLNVGFFPCLSWKVQSL